MLARHIFRLKRHSIWLVAAQIGLWLTHRLVPAQVLKATNEVGGNFLQTFGGMYGIVVAFAIYVVWQQHNDTQVAIEREAVSLGELYRMIGFLGGWPERDHTRTRLCEYALAVPANNTPPLSRVDEGALLERCMSAFIAWKPATPEEERLWPVALDLFHEVNEARELRVTTARLRMGDGLRGFVFIGGVFTVGTLWLMSMDSFEMHMALTALLTWVVVAAASIVFDLDDPYTGDFIVNWRRFRELAERMRGCILNARTLDLAHPLRVEAGERKKTRHHEVVDDGHGPPAWLFAWGYPERMKTACQGMGRAPPGP